MISIDKGMGIVFLEEIKLTTLKECSWNKEKMECIGELSSNILELLPYLNTYLKTAIYKKEINTLTYNYDSKIIFVSDSKVRVLKIVSEEDAVKTFEYLKDIINDCYDKKEQIKPSDRENNLPSSFDVYEILPKINCGKCGQSTCMEFASKLVSGEYKPLGCSQISKPENLKMREEIEDIYLTLGYNL